jgi:hypothetical protein
MIDHGDLISMANNYSENIDISRQIANQIVAMRYDFSTVVKMVFRNHGILFRGQYISNLNCLHAFCKDRIAFNSKVVWRSFNKIKIKKTMIDIVFY